MVFTSFIKVYSLLFAGEQLQSSQSTLPDSAAIEVGGMFDDFFSLEDLEPNLNWREVLAATWGVPYVEDENL